MDDVSPLLVSLSETIRDAIEAIDRNGTGIALVVDAERRLLGTITDGDIRRAILAGLDLGLPTAALLERKADTLHSVPATPVTAAAGASRDEVLRKMRDAELRHLPLLDDAGRVVDMSMLADYVGEVETALDAVVMAGGPGHRLRPLTDATPKPMLPVGERPLLEHIVEQLRDAGVRSVSLTTHYRADQIADYFGSGERFGIDIRYVNEEEPLGTAGSLSLIEAEGSLVVINGDILTNVNFRALARFHEEHAADLTVGVRAFDHEVPFGVVEAVGPMIERIVEKPVTRHLVNAGIYLLGPTARRALVPGKPLSMVELISALIDSGRRVIAFPIHEEWIDIGEPAAYERARQSRPPR